jgi:arginine/lysine/ornithine decarboxylase
VALPRNIHRSVVAGLVLSGALPRFIAHDVLPECGALGVSPDALKTALDADPRPAAVVLTRPSYYGLTRELAELSAQCRARRIPLIVDEAHGAHLHFLPPGYPQGALAAGADLVVQSCHKTLGSLVGSAQLHVGRNSLISPAQVQNALNLLQTTSPSFLLLASLDLTRRRLWREGCDLFAAAVDDARRLEDRIDALPGLRVLRPAADRRLVDHSRDPLRLVVNVLDSGWSGFEVEQFLRNEFCVEDEMADTFNVVYVLGPHDDPAARERLLSGLRAVSERGATDGTRSARGKDSPQRIANALFLQPPIPPLAMSPRQAALAQKFESPLDSAIGRTCAEMVMFYPPGIPMLIPGEKVTIEVIDVCRQLLAAGANAYANDPNLDSLLVMAQ